jgi:tRNA threonylcarbamoyladenosine biosynthesis protein TsaE
MTAPADNFLRQLRDGVTTGSAEETRALAARLAPALPPDRTLALHGNLGVGKTTFVQGLARGLGIDAAITSPTFNIFTIHRGGARTLVHLDAYRLENDRQIESLMLEDFLVSPWCLAVEWPEKIAAWLPAGTWHLTLAIESAGRHHVRLAPG